ncbi:hypothetical protein [Pseudarthrobacter sp. H2]|uniref:hypothetical protein n=1 Tax=Pseudarthrobacter sp. H2 TaxID=3418415 RepID=UPI003CFBA120
MKNDIELDSADQELNEHGDGDQTLSDVSAPRLTGVELALMAQLELSKQRETKARKELQQVRADNARVRNSFEGLLDDAEKRSRIQVGIQVAEQDHLHRIITDLEASSLKAKTAFGLEQKEYSALNTRLLLQVAELEATEGNLKAEVLRLKNEIASYSRTMVNKETFGRDKARRLDTALGILTQERSKIRSLQESSSMRIGRLITSSLKNPWAAVALLWRLPRMIVVETKKNIGGTAK